MIRIPIAVSMVVLCLAATQGFPGAARAAVYTQTVTLPVPPASVFASSAGGDGWDVALSNDKVFNVFHHDPALRVNCHNQSDASPCWPIRVVDDGTSSFSTSGHPGLTFDPATGKLYVYATRTATQQGGVVCVDTVAAATSANPFCGFTPLTGAGEAPLGWFSLLGRPMKVGSKLYAFNYVIGAAAGGPAGTTAQNRLLCFDLGTGSACAGQPYAVDLGGPETLALLSPAPATNVIGSRLFIPVHMGAAFRVACFDASTQAECTGSWPITTGTYAGFNGPVLPLLDASSNARGFCIPNGVDGCFDFAGAATPAPAGLAAAITPTTAWQGPAVTLGPRVYAANGNASNQVQCYDFSTSSGCPGFPKVLADLGFIYTVNKDPARPSCLWVNADNGAKQIQNFDAYTGGACNTIRVLAAQFVVPQDRCNPADYVSLKVLAPVPGSYSSGTVEFDNAAGNQIGIPAATLDATGAVSLTGLSLNTATGLPQFLITLLGAPATVGAVTVQLTWNSTFDASCVGPGAQVKQEPTTITTSLSGGGATGATVTVTAGTVVTDKAALAGPNAAGATGTVTYTWYSDSACTAVAAAGGALPITTPGAPPDSAGVTLVAGTYYPVVSYTGDSGNLASSSRCGDEILQVKPIVPVNRPPVANAGPDQKIKAKKCGEDVVANLNGLASSDPDGDSLTFLWSEGRKVLARTGVARVKLHAGVHTITLTVTDSHGAKSTDTVVITVVDKERDDDRGHGKH